MQELIEICKDRLKILILDYKIIKKIDDNIKKLKNEKNQFIVFLELVETLKGMKLKTFDRYFNELKVLLLNYLNEADDDIELLLDIACTMEEMAKRLYLILKINFKDKVELSKLFEKLSLEEKMHRDVLEKISNKVKNKKEIVKLNLNNIKKMFEEFLNILYIGINQIKEETQALKLAQKLEKSEVNVLFDFILNSFLEEEEKRKLIKCQLKTHVESIDEFIIKNKYKF